MKLSFPVLKTFLPEIKTKSQVIDLLSMYAFEAEDAGGALIEVKLPPNRYSDAGSYIGIAKELSAILNSKKVKEVKLLESKVTKTPKQFSVRAENKEFCPRYCAQYFDELMIKESPKWLKDALVSAGMRPINNVVDVMNYVMMETGQPMHAFDYDLLSPKKKPVINIRSAKKGEELVSLDAIRYSLDPSIGLIADSEKPLVIAGIKGGIGCEVSSNTRRIIVEAANFNPVSIYKTTKKINLSTDASQRFVHTLSIELPAIALSRAAFLLKEIAKAKVGDRFDSLTHKIQKKILAFDISKCNELLGTKLSEKEAATCLVRLGFKNTKKNLWEVPALRTDIETPEDLAEEVARIVGYQNIPVVAPRTSLLSPEENQSVIAKEKIRGILRAFGCNEVYNHSFISRDVLELGLTYQGEAISLINPPSAESQYLRPSLLLGLSKNVEDNFRFYDEVRAFEVGDVFIKTEKGEYSESLHAGIVIGRKNGETFSEIKGITDFILKGMGISDFKMAEVKSKSQTFFFEKALQIESGKKIIGFLGFNRSNVSFIELDLNALLSVQGGSFGYREIEKFPSVVRDVSMFTNLDVRIGELIEEIILSNSLIKDVDLLDEYVDEKWANLQSITLRIIFQSEERTLKGEEVDEIMKEIIQILQKRFGVKMR
ncbi:MAG: phenylalanyl-tRNA synthetase beta chain [Parcubacteria group bacterium LiPW_41]|nr:MAG: phenylalanyl-tRNA synthetase beta chain [Parcubacteria group bacterium LiPW_41]